LRATAGGGEVGPALHRRQTPRDGWRRRGRACPPSTLHAAAARSPISAVAPSPSRPRRRTGFESLALPLIPGLLNPASRRSCLRTSIEGGLGRISCSWPVGVRSTQASTLRGTIS
ncbi:Os08g0363200, partial [Oryza sativa Japonica Group]